MASAPQLVLLLTSPRVVPGLMTRSAWQVLEQADVVLCADVDDAVPAAVAVAGVPVTADRSTSVAERARALVSRAAAGATVWVGSPDGDPGLTDALAAELSRVAATQDPPAVEVLVGSQDVPGARLLDLVAVMDRLRSPGGCPWDRDQTHESLVPYLVEEAYEAAEALESGDRDAVREELGDVLLQVVFHARIAQEHPQQPFDVDDVAAGIVAKLVSRHPHVFAPDDEQSSTAEQVQERWDELKAAEKGRASVLDGIPLALPALGRADKVLGRLGRAPGGEAVAATSVGEPVGDALLDVVRQARRDGVDAESALRQAVRVLEQRFRDQEASA
ncbi:nucleoside triphosphate pyrophosphohydrolase [Angustibacter peucedani]